VRLHVADRIELESIAAANERIQAGERWIKHVRDFVHVAPDVIATPEWSQTVLGFESALLRFRHVRAPHESNDPRFRRRLSAAKTTPERD
jgi:hypothetical protein